MLVLIGLAVCISIAGQMQVAYGHGCQAQGGCCTVGGPCVETSANSPIYLMFVVVGLAGAMLFKFYGGPEQGKRLYSIFNIFS